MDRVLICKIFIFLVLTFVALIDIKKMYIPNFLNILLLILGIYYKGFGYDELERSLLGMGVYVIPILLLYAYLSDFLGKDVFGFGDIKLVLGLGYILGYTNFFDVYVFYTIAFVSSSIVGFLYLFFKKRKRSRHRKSVELPFSPHLILAFIYLWVVV